MNIQNNILVYHFFHAGLEHHNLHMLPLFANNDAESDIKHICILVDSRRRLVETENYDLVIRNITDFISFIYKSLEKKNVLLIHGLYSNWYYLMPILRPSLAKNIIWDVWGDDYFSTQKLIKSSKLTDKIRYQFRRYSIPKFGALAGFRDDVASVAKHYKHQNKHFFINHPLRGGVNKVDINLAALKNIHFENGIKVLIGNSGSRSNQHQRALEQLKMLPIFSQLELYCIFSVDIDYVYFEEFKSYIDEHKFHNIHIVQRIMSERDFIDFIDDKDIVIMPHQRQQGVGTTNLSLLLGKPVFMDLDISTAKYYLSENIKVFDVNKLDELLSLNFNGSFRLLNAKKIKQLFGRKAIKENWLSLILAIISNE